MKKRVKKKEISKEKIVLIIGIILIIASLAISIPVYVRESRCKNGDLKDDLKTMFIIGPPGLDCPASSLSGDVNNDNCVDAADLAALVDHWLSGCGTTFKPPCGSTDCLCIHSDMTGDGCVNADDFAILAAHWGEGEGCSTGS